MDDSASNQIKKNASFLSKSGFGSNSPTYSSSSSSSSSAASYSNNSFSNSTNRFVDFFKNITWTTWFVIFIILTLLGINIFAYLSEGTAYTANLLDRITKWFSGIVGTPIKQTVNVSAIGTKAGINTATTTTTNAIDIATKPFKTNTGTDPSGTPAYTSQLPQTLQNQSTNVESDDVITTTLQKPLSKTTNVQSHTASSNKSGWCFIGEEEGIRSCIDVGLNDICMSGDIFPTNAVCVNPNLRV